MLVYYLYQDADSMNKSIKKLYTRSATTYPKLINWCLWTQHVEHKFIMGVFVDFRISTQN